MINWYEIVKSIATNPGKVITADVAIWNTNNPEYIEIYKLWQDCNVNMSSIRWINYYPGLDFDQSVVDEFAKLVNVTPLRSWISRIDPGYCAPLHYDIDDNESEYLENGTLYRFTCFIIHPIVGHVMAVDKEYLHSQPLGAVYAWPNYRAWHGAMNAGLRSNYMFHLIGY
jgi:hypothetical protein